MFLKSICTLQHTATHTHNRSYRPMFARQLFVLWVAVNPYSSTILQHTAAHCQTLQHTAKHCKSLQLTATHCSTLQHTATHTHDSIISTHVCKTAVCTLGRRQSICLDNTATHCNTLPNTATHCKTLQHTATHCSTLQYTAAHCNTLQPTGAHCNSMQHTAPHCAVCTVWCSVVQCGAHCAICTV